MCSGRVRSVHKGLGDGVAVGDLLCVLESVDLGNAVADYLEDHATLESAELTLFVQAHQLETRPVQADQQ